MGGIVLLIILSIWYMRRRSRRRILDADMSPEADMTEERRSMTSLVTPFIPSSSPPTSTAFTNSNYLPHKPKASRGGTSQVSSAKEVRLEYGGEHVQGGLQRRQSELEARLASGGSAGENADIANIRRELDLVRAQMEELRHSSTIQGINPPPSYVAED